MTRRPNPRLASRPPASSLDLTSATTKPSTGCGSNSDALGRPGYRAGWDDGVFDATRDNAGMRTTPNPYKQTTR